LLSIPWGLETRLKPFVSDVRKAGNGKNPHDP
jgi:hypothetical protein